MRSPRLAAMGVATLSGLMLHFLENTTTAAITEPRMSPGGGVILKIDVFSHGYAVFCAVCMQAMIHSVDNVPS